jgi:hypothetical protein
MTEGHTEVPEKGRDYEAPAITTLGTVDELTAGNGDDDDAPNGSPINNDS